MSLCVVSTAIHRTVRRCRLPAVVEVAVLISVLVFGPYISPASFLALDSPQPESYVLLRTFPSSPVVFPGLHLANKNNGSTYLNVYTAISGLARTSLFRTLRNTPAKIIIRPDFGFPSGHFLELHAGTRARGRAGALPFPLSIFSF